MIGIVGFLYINICIIICSYDYPHYLYIFIYIYILTLLYRLAMIGIMGFLLQAAASGEGVVQQLGKNLVWPESRAVMEGKYIYICIIYIYKYIIYL
jgi:hypothetical protein